MVVIGLTGVSVGVQLHFGRAPATRRDEMVCEPAKSTTFEIGTTPVSVDGSHRLWYGWNILDFSYPMKLSVC